MRVFDIEQQTPEWYKMRAGVLTGTGLKNIMIGGYNKDGSINAAAKKAMLGMIYKLIGGEFSFDEDAPNPTTYAMKKGNELEPIARAKFEAQTGKKVTEIGFCKKEDWLGLSPDGFIETKINIRKTASGDIPYKVYGEAVEIKCPIGENSAKFFKYKFEGLDAIKNDSDKYIWQIVQYFIVNNELEKMNFVLFNPNLPSEKQLHIIEIQREDIAEEIEKAQKRILEFRELWVEKIKLLLD